MQYPIPGFPKYEIDETGRVLSMTTGCFLVLDERGCVRLHKNGRTIHRKPKALLEAAVAGIALADPVAQVAKPTPNLDSTLEALSFDPAMSGLDARECWVGW